MKNPVLFAGGTGVVGNLATELIVEIDGESQGKCCQRRLTIEFDKGQAALTALSTVLTLSNVLGLEQRPCHPAGLYSRTIVGALKGRLKHTRRSPELFLAS